MIPDQDEIAQIERELEILRSRQALLARWYRITMIYLAITFPMIAALITAIIYGWSSDILAIIYALSSDIVVVAFIVGMTAIVAGLIWIIGRPSSVPPDQQQPSQFLPIGGFRPWVNYKSDAETIHDMIVLRKQRLAELKGEAPPSCRRFPAWGEPQKQGADRPNGDRSVYRDDDLRECPQVRTPAENRTAQIRTAAIMEPTTPSHSL